MPTLNPKTLVQNALNTEWPAFAQRHPHLAAVIDQSLLVEHAANLLEDDPAYRQAMQSPSAADEAMQTIADLVGRIVSQLLSKLTP